MKDAIEEDERWDLGAKAASFDENKEDMKMEMKKRWEQDSRREIATRSWDTSLSRREDCKTMLTKLGREMDTSTEEKMFLGTSTCGGSPQRFLLWVRMLVM